MRLDAPRPSGPAGSRKVSRKCPPSGWGARSSRRTISAAVSALTTCTRDLCSRPVLALAKFRENRARILAAIEHDLSNGLVESTNTKTRLITRIAFGFHSAQALIALAMLNLGGHRPTLPGRN